MGPVIRRSLIALTVVVVAALIVAFGVRALFRAASGHHSADGCTVGDYHVDTDQAAIASTMVAVVLKRDLPERAAVLTLAAALQESKLRNLALGDGDRDSVGVLQQRPSQGWGTEAQLHDIHYATGKFLDAVLKVKNWQTGQLADVVQEVQISIDGRLYAVHEGEAQALADTFTGKTPAGISCVFAKPGSVAAPTTVITRLTADLPVNTPTAGQHSVSVSGASWATAAWFVAHGDQLGIDRVDYNGRQWNRSKPWKDNTKAAAGAVVATLHS